MLTLFLPAATIESERILYLDSGEPAATLTAIKGEPQYEMLLDLHVGSETFDPRITMALACVVGFKDLAFTNSPSIS